MQRNAASGGGLAVNRNSSSNAGSVEEYLAALPEERRADLQRVREVVRRNLPEGYREEMGFGMIAYVIPLETYPATYNRQPLMYAALGNQKRHMALYLMNIYGDPATQEWFAAAYAASGKRLDMGKSCVRFKRADDLPLELIAQAVARTPAAEYIAGYEAARAQLPRRRRKG